MRWVYRPYVEHEVSEIAQYYGTARNGLGDRFLEALEDLFSRLSSFPDSAKEVRPGIRQAVLGDFPYLIYYARLEDRFEILAVVHQARHESVWQDRL